MDLLKCLSRHHQMQTPSQAVGKTVDNLRCIPIHEVLDETTYGFLMQAFSGWIYWHDATHMERFTLIGVDRLEIGVMHLFTIPRVRVQTNLAAHNDPLARSIALAHVCLVKLKPQATNRPGGVADDDLIESPASPRPATARDEESAFKGFLSPNLQITNRLQVGTVFIAPRQQGQRVTDALNPQASQPLGPLRTDTFDELQRLG